MLLMVFILLLIANQGTMAQPVTGREEENLESLTEAEQGTWATEEYLLGLEKFRKQPLNLNLARKEELRELGLLSDMQIDHLISYRELLGPLVDLYELQAVPTWDLYTARKLLPFITIHLKTINGKEMMGRFEPGTHGFIFRLGRVLERSEGYRQGTGNRYPGSPLSVFFRYKYAYKHLLQFGITLEKDEGEQFFRGAQRRGFDFSSFHFFAGNLGVVKTIILGDFIVNMGQGLLQWHGLAFRKSGDAMNLKRQAALLKPYSAAGEFYFFRGIGITLGQKKFSATLFASHRRMDANFITDTIYQTSFISSFLPSGLHRTINEINDRKSTAQTVIGTNLQYDRNKWRIGFNGILFRFSNPVNKTDEPYNLYALNGNKWVNAGIHYSYTFGNCHFFGEMAADKHFSKAFLNGLLIAVDRNADISILHRVASRGYQSVNGNAFTENTLPTNENGLYTGISVRPANGIRVDAYADVFKFPWLRFSSDAPSGGYDFLARVTYTPSKRVECYTRFRLEKKMGNLSSSPLDLIVMYTKLNWRTNTSFKLTPDISLRNRVELVRFQRGGKEKQSGYLGFLDFLYKPMMKRYSVITRLQYFESDGYESRIYAYENDLLYSYSVPSFYDEGFRYNILVSFGFAGKIDCSLKLAGSIYKNRAFLGEGSDRIPGNRKTEARIQVKMGF